jgi:hypothetical protein
MDGSEGFVGMIGCMDVRAFGAAGDGSTDDTCAFTKALYAVAVSGGIVHVPAGNYAIRGHLTIPPNVTLEGVFRAPTARSQYKGSTLLCFEGSGEPEGNPFLFLQDNSTVKGLTILYPEQDRIAPRPYPWCIRGRGDNCSIIDVLLVNPYDAVDFGTHPCGRHLIRGLYAQPLHHGVLIDQCYDVGRIEDVHLWPFWDESLRGFTEQDGIGFIFGRTDWEYVVNCFCIFYRTGFLFKEFEQGPGNVLILNSGSDIGPRAVHVEKVMAHAGIAFSNCQFMAGIEVEPGNEGPVKFSNCGFWGIDTTDTHAVLRGTGPIGFHHCHFIRWDRSEEGHPAIFSEAQALTVMGCDFKDPGHRQVVLGELANSSIILGNRMSGGIRIESLGSGSSIIKDNLAG